VTEAEMADILPREIHGTRERYPFGRVPEWNERIDWKTHDDLAWLRHYKVSRAHNRKVSLQILGIFAMALASWAILWWSADALMRVSVTALELLP
jgi:hypothetical protein